MKKWDIRVPEKSIVSKLTFGCGIGSLAAAVLASRGYSSPESVAESLNVSELSDPFLIKDMDKAADTINAAIDAGERICVYGDYDCDGITAAVILYSYLLEAGADVSYYIPERAEGYGLNAAAIEKIAADGTGLIVTVDNGISAISEAELVYELGMKLVVTDHHQQGDSLPRAEAVVDPHRKDCFSTFKHMCGAGLALKLVSALDGGDYTMALEQFGDLAAIATIADVVPLTGENRFLVSYGLELVNNADRPALIALKEVSGYSEKKADAFAVAFGLAPRINASGRFGSPKLAAELFLCEDYDEALPLAKKLDELNVKRKAAENEILAQIYAAFDADPSLANGRTIFVRGENWDHGVIGIVAARLLERFGKPVFIASEIDGEVRGSARAFGEFSVFGALSYAADALEKFGGHPAAGGFTIKRGMEKEFRELLEKYALENHKIPPIYDISADAPVSPAELNVKDVSDLALLGPFGAGNEKPLFYIESALVLDVIPLSGGAHSKLRIKLGYGRFDVLVFRTPPASLACKKDDVCDMIVSLSVKEFRGEDVLSIIAEDIRPHGFIQSRYFDANAAFEAFLRGEELPANYYPRMLPERRDVVAVYKAIPDAGERSDVIYMRLGDPRVNYCRFRAAVEALRQLGLINYSSADSVVTKVKVSRKADLDSAPVLAALKSKLAVAPQTSANGV